VTFARFLDAQHEPDRRGLALFFPRRIPTGEHVLELHGHGGPVKVIERWSRRAVELGARPCARPWSSPSVPFLNDKWTWRRRKPFADLIDAGSREALRAAIAPCRGSSPPWCTGSPKR